MSPARLSLRRTVARALRPPERLSHAAWAAKNFRLSGNSAAPGKFRPWKAQRQILDAFGDPLLPKVSVMKATRTGFTTCLVADIGATAINDPCPIMLLVPTDDDARGMVVDEIDPAFKATPALNAVMRIGRFDGRNTLTHRTLSGGGTLKVISARAPRNLRRHTVKRLYGDEVDGMEITAEGDPLKLAEKRTTSFPDRKIIYGSTPTDEETSIIAKRYEDSDQRIFEVPCPHCSGRFEILWEHIHWPDGKPEEAVCSCPHCGTDIEERFKPQMEEDGEFRATKPEVKGHAGFRWNALVSLFANASWGILAQEYILAQKNGAAELQVFYNTVLGRPWSNAINYVGEHILMGRVEDFGIASEGDGWREDIPSQVAYLTAGVDVQVDRFECTFIGWDEDYRWILGKHVIFGPTNLDSTWDALDAVLSTRFKHPLGGSIGFEAAGVDAGDGNRTQQVYDFCATRLDRKIVAIKGVPGPQPVIAVSRSKHKRFRGATFFRVGVDQVKTDILVTLPVERTDREGKPNKQAFRYSNSLDSDWFTQFTSEKRQIRYVRGKPVVEFVRIGGRQAEALDSTVYGIAVKSLCRFDFDKRRVELTGQKPAKTSTLAESLKKLHAA